MVIKNIKDIFGYSSKSLPSDFYHLIETLKKHQEVKEETFNLIRIGFSKPWEIKFLDQLYLAQERDIIREIHNVQTATNNLLVIGHNPGVGSLACTLASRGNNQLGMSLPICTTFSGKSH